MTAPQDSAAELFVCRQKTDTEIFHMWVASDWADYSLLDSGGGEKLERWGTYVLRRPDPQAVWTPAMPESEWECADAVYHRSKSGGGSWEIRGKIPGGLEWDIAYRGLRMGVRLMQFKHTGVFPEQAVNWDYMSGKIASCNQLQVQADSSKPPAVPRVLNLFAYTGAATAAIAAAGARVCHIDAARGIVADAKENARKSGILYEMTRFIVDDVLKFVKREQRRGSRYDAIVMDPPSYGRGPDGELWKSETHLYDLVTQCAGLMSETPLFFVINSYASGLSPTSIENILLTTIGKCRRGRTESAEIGLPEAARQIILPCGCTARWEPL
jgi:23S rRNA (cytosine1962-C5)-methyltransferase